MTCSQWLVNGYDPSVAGLKQPMLYSGENPLSEILNSGLALSGTDPFAVKKNLCFGCHFNDKALLHRIHSAIKFFAVRNNAMPGRLISRLIVPKSIYGCPTWMMFPRAVFLARPRQWVFSSKEPMTRSLQVQRTLLVCN